MNLSSIMVCKMELGGEEVGKSVQWYVRVTTTQYFIQVARERKYLGGIKTPTRVYDLPRSLGRTVSIAKNVECGKEAPTNGPYTQKKSNFTAV